MHKKNNTHILIGAHISIEGGFYKAIARAEEIGCTAMQIFTKSNRQWHAKAITQKEIDLFDTAWKQSSVQCITAHASYLINIGSPQEEIALKSTKALIQELERCNMLNIKTLTLHPGSRLKSSVDDCLDRIVENINAALSDTDNTILLLETMAGQGSNVGNSFEEIAYIISNIEQKKRIGVTLDTCHIFAAGYDIANKKGYTSTIKQFDEIIGLNKLHILHLNDSKKSLGSCVDRHEEIGDGAIGIDGFTYIMQDKNLASIPKILETPDPKKYAQTIDLLKRIA